MALFGPQARLERCLWWAELTGWPHGASAERKAACYDRVLGRASGTGGSGRQLSVQNKPVEPKNDLLTLAVVLVVGFLIYKYALK